MRTCFAVVLLMVCGIALGQENQRIRIGSKAATMLLAGDWQRVNVSPDLGRDQFASKRKYILAVVEQESVLAGESEFDQTLSAFAESIKVQDPGMVSTNRPFVWTKGLGHASITLSCKISGFKLSYEVHLVGRDGLHYMFIGWAPSTDKFTLAGEMRRIVGSFEMPPADSEWGKQAAPVQVVARGGGNTYKFKVQKTIFNVNLNQESGRICSLVSKDDQTGCHIFSAQEGGEPEEMVGRVVNVLRAEFPDIKETKREDVTAAGKACLQVTLEGTNKAGVARCFITTIVPLGESRYAEVRYVFASRLDSRKTYLDAILKTLEIAGPAKVDAFADAKPKIMAKPLAPAKQALLGASKVLATFDPAPARVMSLPDGSIFGLGQEKAYMVRPDTTNSVVLLTFDDRNYMRHGAYRDGILWYTSAKGKLVCFAEGKSKVLDCDASLVDVVGKDALLLVRKNNPPAVPGFDLVGGSQLIVRGADGRERILKKTGMTIPFAAADAAGRKILVASVADWRMRAMVGSDTELAVIDVESGRENVLSGWKMVQDVCGSEGCWLVNGQPKDAPPGLYRVVPEGAPELLVSGAECRGVALVAGALVFSSALALENTQPEKNRLHVYKVPVAVARKEGPAWHRLFGALIQRIAENAFGRSKLNPYTPDSFATRKQFDDFIENARKASRELAGVELPATPEGVNDIFSDYSIHSDMKAEGMILLSALLAQTLLDQNAQWTDGTPSVLWAGRGNAASSEKSAFVYACAPGAIVASILYDDESSFYLPATTCTEQAKGRRVVLSGDTESVVKTCEESDRTFRNMLKEANTNAIATLLKKHPQNIYLRELAYGYLMATRPVAEVEQLAAAFTSGETPLIDLRVVLGAQSARAAKGDNAELIRSLRNAISRFPEEAAFYAMLGNVYEKSGIADSGELARKCYDAVLGMAQYGALAKEAKAGLARIDGTPVDQESDEE